ncbi:Transmembrane protein 70, mitochondrial, partial [Varanus komodoensis]
MLLAAGVGARPEAVVARAPCLRLWLRGAARGCSAQRGAAAAAKGAAPGRSLQSALRCRLRPRGGWPAASGSLPEMLGHGRVPFSCVESLCCFSTSPLPENSEYGRLVYRGNLAKAVL